MVANMFFFHFPYLQCSYTEGKLGSPRITLPVVGEYLQTKENGFYGIKTNNNKFKPSD